MSISWTVSQLPWLIYTANWERPAQFCLLTRSLTREAISWNLEASTSWGWRHPSLVWCHEARNFTLTKMDFPWSSEPVSRITWWWFSQPVWSGILYVEKMTDSCWRRGRMHSCVNGRPSACKSLRYDMGEIAWALRAVMLFSWKLSQEWSQEILSQLCWLCITLMVKAAPYVPCLTHLFHMVSFLPTRRLSTDTAGPDTTFQTWIASLIWSEIVVCRTMHVDSDAPVFSEFAALKPASQHDTIPAEAQKSAWTSRSSREWDAL